MKFCHLTTTVAIPELVGVQWDTGGIDDASYNTLKQAYRIHICIQVV